MRQLVELAQGALYGPEIDEQGGRQRSTALGMLLRRHFRLMRAVPRRLSKIDNVGQNGPEDRPEGGPDEADAQFRHSALPSAPGPARATRQAGPPALARGDQ